MGIEEITEGDGEGEKGRFWGGGDRQSHRGPALSLTGWGSPPGRRGKGCPQIPPPATPLTTLSPLSRPLCFPCLPLFLAHTAAPPASCTLLCTPACLSPPWATILHKSALSLSCTLRLCSSSRALFALFPLHTLHFFSHTPCPLFSPTLAYTLFPWRPPLHTSLLKISGPLLQTHLGHPFPSPTHRFCAHTYCLEYPCLCSTLAHSISYAPLLRCLHFL